MGKIVIFGPAAARGRALLPVSRLVFTAAAAAVAQLFFFLGFQAQHLGRSRASRRLRQLTVVKDGVASARA